MRDRRKALRYPFGAEGRLHPPSGGAGTNVMISDISPLGCAVDSRGGAKFDKKCELYFDWQGLEVGLQAQVVWRDGNGKMGLKFYSVDRDTQARLNDLCAALAHRLTPTSRSDEIESPRLPSEARIIPESAPPRAAPLRPHQKRERRRVPRYVSELRASVSSPHSPSGSSVTLVTLSILGGCLEGEALPEPGQPFELHTEWEGKPLLVRGDVVWKKRDQAGVKFGSLDSSTERVIREICSNLRLQPLAPPPPEPPG